MERGVQIQTKSGITCTIYDIHYCIDYVFYCTDYGRHGSHICPHRERETTNAYCLFGSVGTAPHRGRREELWRGPHSDGVEGALAVDAAGQVRVRVRLRCGGVTGRPSGGRRVAPSVVIDSRVGDDDRGDRGTERGAPILGPVPHGSVLGVSNPAGQDLDVVAELGVGHRLGSGGAAAVRSVVGSVILVLVDGGHGGVVPFLLLLAPSRVAVQAVDGREGIPSVRSIGSGVVDSFFQNVEGGISYDEKCIKEGC